MTDHRQARLRMAMAGARQVLGRDGVTGRPALSNLNRLRGIESTEDSREGTLLSRTGVKQRPVFDLVADQILGTNDDYQPTIELKENEDTMSGFASRRLASLRERQLTEELEEELLGDSIGVLEDGRPIWSEVLDRQRGYAINMPEFSFKDSSFRPKWPSTVSLSDHNTWQSWHVIEENARASIACEKVVDKPGTTMNPLLILGGDASGKSHLLNATTQAMVRRGLGNVHLISVAAMRGWNNLPEGWQEAMAHASILAIDDIHLAEERIATELGLMIDHALNLGVQVVTTARIEPEKWQARRLWEVMRSATSVWMRMPSVTSLITHLRQETAGRALLLDDSMLARIVSHSSGDWRSCDAQFEKVALAIEAGELVSDADDITNILEDRPMNLTRDEQISRREEIESLAERVVDEALDHVYTGTDIGGVDLHSPMPELSDNWQVPELSIAEKDELHEVLTSKHLTPHVSTTLTVDERDEFLIESATGEMDSYDKVRVRETTAGIDNITEQMFNEMTRSHQKQSNRLKELEEEMRQLATLSSTADVEELILIADRLQEIETELAIISPQPGYATLTPVTILTPLGESE